MNGQNEQLEKRKVGIGTLSLVLSVFAFLFLVSHKEDPSLGDRIVSALGFAPWSGGTAKFHNTILYSIPIIALAAILGFRYPKDFGAHIGRNMAILCGIFVIILAAFAIKLGVFTFH
jgi:hypothetical protein